MLIANVLFSDSYGNLVLASQHQQSPISLVTWHFATFNRAMEFGVTECVAVVTG